MADERRSNHLRGPRAPGGAARRPDAPRVRGADADPARGDPAAPRRAATCSARPRPAPARPPRSRCRSSSASSRSAGRRAPAALVLVPTRELAMQVSEAMHKYGRGLGVRVLPVYGGQPIRMQLRALERGVDVVVATPGRALDHLGRGTLSLDAVETVVLDEADEMLDMGFAEDLEAILDAVAGRRQTVLFSATMPPRLDGIVKRHLQRAGADRDRRATQSRGRGGEGAPDGLHRPAGAQAGRARPRARRRGADRRARLLPHARRGRQAHRDAQRPRLPRRGAARRHDPGAARPRDGPPARRRRRPAASRPTSPPAAWTSTRSRTSSTTTCRPRPRPTCTASAASAAPAARASRSRSPSRASTACCKTIERVTKQQIAVEKIPTVADLRARRLELTRAGARGVAARGRRPRPLPRGRRDARRGATT